MLTGALSSLESESIEIIREAVACGRNPVMMYSIGKDSSVMLHLARKAFYPAPPISAVACRHRLEVQSDVRTA